jgi:hypothetical protein
MVSLRDQTIKQLRDEIAALKALLRRVEEYAAVLPQEIVCDIEMVLEGRDA